MFRPQSRDAARAPLLNEDDGAEADADDQKRDNRGHGTQRIKRRRRDVERHAPDLQRQGVQRAGGLKRPGELVIGQRESEQRDRHQARRQNRNDHQPDGLPAGAPRSRAASSQAGLKRDITANITRTPNGNVQDSCAPSADVYRMSSMPMH